jgi:hypothetical protein
MAGKKASSSLYQTHSNGVGDTSLRSPPASKMLGENVVHSFEAQGGAPVVSFEADGATPVEYLLVASPSKAPTVHPTNGASPAAPPAGENTGATTAAIIDAACTPSSSVRTDTAADVIAAAMIDTAGNHHGAAVVLAAKALPRLALEHSVMVSVTLLAAECRRELHEGNEDGVYPGVMHAFEK